MTVGDTTTSYEYDKDNRLLTETTTDDNESKITRYGYDGNGNQIYKATETIRYAEADEEECFKVAVVGKDTETSNIQINEYDGFNRLVKVSTGDIIAEYGYNADGLRISKKVNGEVVRHIWCGDQIALELDDSGLVTNKYVRGINLIFSESGISASRRYFLYNGHGDVVQLTDQSGDVVKSYDYDAFGNEKNIDDSDNNPFRYCGEYFDKETGTYYLRARYYNRSLTETSMK